MDADFWLRLWERDQTPRFHGAAPNPLLTRTFPALALPPGSRLFVPLCGRTADIGWLTGQGHRVVGAELSPLATSLLFADLGLTPEVRPAGRLSRHAAGAVEVFVGDVFDLTADLVGPVDAVWDRAALIALPGPVRRRYAPHVTGLAGGARQLLAVYERGGDPESGPPFPVGGDEVARLYGDRYRITHLARLPWFDNPGPPAGYDMVWLLD
jgi:thiopurine S-methyltransferase